MLENDPEWRVEDEGGTLTARGLVILVIREEIVQSLFTGVGVLLLLIGEGVRDGDGREGGQGKKEKREGKNQKEGRLYMK